MTSGRSTIEVEGRAVGAGHPTLVIAEIGVNHDGSEELAARMIEAAAVAGADAVKFQTVDARMSYLPGTASYDEFIGRALSEAAYVRLNRQARELGLIPFSTPGDLPSLALMVRSGMQAIKVSSGQLTNLPLMRAAARTGLPIIVSTGMADEAGVRHALAALELAGARQVAVLHCTSLYPAPASSLNLRAIPALAAALPCPVGYSDHFMGPEAAIAAVALGASIIEKHFSLDRSRRGADHHLSAEPGELAAMIRSIRAVEAMLGSGVKSPVDEELRLAPQRWRYLVAGRDLAAGEPLDATVLVAKRVADAAGGLRAADIDLVIGRRLRRPLAADALLRESDLEVPS